MASETHNIANLKHQSLLYRGLAPNVKGVVEIILLPHYDDVAGWAIQRGDLPLASKSK